MTAPRFPPIRKAPTLVEQVSQQLALKLTDGTGIVGGKLMAERGLAAQLGVSRNVLREAIKRLEMQGLLEIRQGHGTKVVRNLHKPLTSALKLLVTDETERFEQLFDARLLIEPETARLAAAKATREQFLQIQSCQERLKVAQTVEESVQADMDFHRAIAEASGNRVLLLVIESLAEILSASQSIGFRLVDHSQPIRRHQAVLDAIEKGDGERAAAEMAAHIEEARSIFESAVAIKTAKKRKMKAHDWKGCASVGVVCEGCNG